MPDLQYQHITRWNELLDELCNRTGFLDTASLASRFCELSNRGGQKEFETAIRNLNNWRSGRHIPRLRSLKVLEQLLALDEQPTLLERWHTLYRQASEAEEDDESTEHALSQLHAVPPRTTTGRGDAQPSLLRMTGAAIVLFGVGLATGLLWNSEWRPWGGPADNAPIVTYEPEIRMAVGESRIIHSERGDCGKLPREWVDVVAALPTSQTGSFSDGGLVRRNSKFCKGFTPARAIVFTPTMAGVEEFLIQGDFLKVTAVAAEAGT